MTGYKGYIFELDPNNVQRTLFLKACGVARFVYNWGIATCIKAYANKEKHPSGFDLSKKLNAIKHTEFPWMKEVSKHIPQQSFGNLEEAYTGFFKKLSGFPRFKKKKAGQGSFYLGNGNKDRDIRIEGKHVLLPRIGLVRLKHQRPLPGRILSATISQRADKWFVSLKVEYTLVVPDNQGPSVGIDLGISTLATISDGNKFQNHNALESSLKKLKRLQQSLSRSKKGSNRCRVKVKKLARLHYRISCRRLDSIHKMTHRITTSYSEIGRETLSASNMMKNHKLARRLADSSFGEINRQLKYKSEWYGCKEVLADRFYPSSKRCCQCGNVKDTLELGTRVYHCDSCGMTMDRDLNASMNLRPEVLRSLGVDGEALVAAVKTVTKPTRLKRQPSILPKGGN